MPHESAAITLPVTMVTLAELENLQQELAAIADFFAQTARRQPGTPVTPPAASLSLEYMAKQYGCNLLDKNDRQKLTDMLHEMRRTARPIHITFASQPPNLWLQRICAWFRENVDKNILLKVSYAPHLVSGCTVKASVRTYDLSMGRRLDDARPVLLQGILAKQFEPGRRQLTEGSVANRQ
jgi:hypothetical protein